MRDYEEKSYYEIQLDNKQLVLVFLASITVCILIFVLGVMVGKGKKETELAALSKKETVAPQVDSRPPVEPQVAMETEQEPKQAPKQAKQMEEAEPKEPEGYSFYDLDKTETPRAEKEPPPQKEKTPAKQPAKEVIAKPEISLPSPETVLRYTVQVMATSSEAKAMEQLSRLKEKGYSSAFLDEDQTEEGPVYKVRVGKFSDHDSARQTASELKQQLKLDTWVAVLD